MKKATYKFVVLDYDELSPESREAALEELRYINVDYEWWDWSVEEKAGEWEAKYGITFEPSDICFDLNPRYRTMYWPKNKIGVADAYKLLAAVSANRGYGLLASKDLLIPYFETVHYGGGQAVTYLQVQDYRNEASKDLPFSPEGWFREIVRDFWRELDKEYDSLITDDAIVNTIRANEFKFFEDGKRCRNICAA